MSILSYLGLAGGLAAAIFFGWVYFDRKRLQGHLETAVLAVSQAEDLAKISALQATAARVAAKIARARLREDYEIEAHRKPKETVTADDAIDQLRDSLLTPKD